jgi:hypothetical protein
MKPRKKTLKNFVKWYENLSKRKLTKKELKIVDKKFDN